MGMPLDEYIKKAKAKQACPKCKQKDQSYILSRDAFVSETLKKMELSPIWTGGYCGRCGWVWTVIGGKDGVQDG